MPQNLPKNPTTALLWLEARAELWVDRAGDLGLPEGLAQEVRDLVADARDKRLRADEAAEKAKAATLAWRISVRALLDRARAAIAAIKTHAAVTGDAGVYSRAHLSRPDKPGEVGPPRSPWSLAWDVRTDGAIELTWNGGGPQGTYYVVRRAMPHERDYVLLGTTTSKRFTDDTLPDGAVGTRYAVSARHGEHDAPGDIVELRMGSKPRAAGARRAS